MNTVWIYGHSVEKLYLELLFVGGADHGGKHVGQGFSGETVEESPQLRYYRHWHIQHSHQLSRNNDISKLCHMKYSSNVDNR